jgi:cytochrome c biogenesis protein CcmG/thiol:disulfide interchange protein DsbE
MILCAALLSQPPLILAQASSPLVHRAAPDFSRTSLGKKKIDLRGYRGKVVLLNFWATWCAPCLIEMPTFAKWQTLYGDDKLQVIGVSMDDDANPVGGVVARLKINYPVLMGDEELGEAYGGILGLPVTFLIDRKGVVQKRYQGAADLQELRQEIDRLLRAP